MPLNLVKTYNALLDFGGMNSYQRKNSLLLVFNRDFKDNTPIVYNSKEIFPTPKDGEDSMDRLFKHLTTTIVDKQTRKREYDNDRSARLHWIRFHIDLKKIENVLAFSVKEPSGIRTYIYDIDESYVIILEPLRKVKGYYLLTAYYLKGKDKKRNKILKKYKRRLKEMV